MVDYYDDRLVFFDDFAINVIIGDIEFRKTIKAIFDDKSTMVDGGGVEGWVTTAPQLICRTEEIDTLEQLERVTLPGGKSYQVSEIKPDGTGITTLLLHEEYFND
jgi:hypothetical protein